MKRYIEAESFIRAMEGYKHTYGRVARKFADEHAVEAVAVGDPLDGYVIEVYKADDGRDAAKLRRMEELNGKAEA